MRELLDGEVAKKVLPKEQIAEVLGYLRNHWDALRVSLSDGRVPIDNNDVPQCPTAHRTHGPGGRLHVRRHACLSPESMKKWRVGVLPMDGGGDKRGLSVRGYVTSPLLSKDGKVLAWIGRDPNHEQKARDFARLTPGQRTGQTPPTKHRFPRGVHRG